MNGMDVLRGLDPLRVVAEWTCIHCDTPAVRGSGLELAISWQSCELPLESASLLINIQVGRPSRAFFYHQGCRRLAEGAGTWTCVRLRCHEGAASTRRTVRQKDPP